MWHTINCCCHQKGPWHLANFPANPNFSNSTAPDLGIREKTPHLIPTVHKSLEAHSSMLRHALKRGLLLEILGIDLATT